MLKVEPIDAIAQVQSNPLVQKMIDLEPELLLILKTAALFTEGNRWHMYEELKRQTKPFVGWDARKPELRAERFYEAMIKAIDSLLPDEA